MSSARSDAELYRWSGSFSIVFITMVSRSRGMPFLTLEGRGGFSVETCLSRRAGSSASRAGAQGQELVESEAETKDVAARVACSVQTLRCQVTHRAGDVTGRGQIANCDVHLAGQSKIGQEDGSLRIEQQV